MFLKLECFNCGNPLGSANIIYTSDHEPVCSICAGEIDKEERQINNGNDEEED